VEKAAVSLNRICQRLSDGGEGGHTAIEAPSGRLGKPVKHVPQLECGSLHLDPPRTRALNMKRPSPPVRAGGFYFGGCKSP